MTQLPIVTVSPTAGGWIGSCDRCGWAFLHLRRHVVDTASANHRASHQKGVRG